MFSSLLVFFSYLGFWGGAGGRAAISHRAFYLLHYVDVINLGLWSEASWWDIDTCLEFDVGVDGPKTMTNPSQLS